MVMAQIPLGAHPAIQMQQLYKMPKKIFALVVGGYRLAVGPVNIMVFLPNIVVRAQARISLLELLFLPLSLVVSILVRLNTRVIVVIFGLLPGLIVVICTTLTSILVIHVQLRTTLGIMATV